MKQFEKWREIDSRGAGMWTTAAYKKGWKAALEWVKRELPRAEAGFINPDLGLGDILNKELEE
jgi:hypothetical protein